MELASIFLNKILSETAKRVASVLYLSVGSKPVMKIDGQLYTFDSENIVTNDLLTSILDNTLSPEEQEILKKEKELTVVKIFGGSFRFRVNIFYQKKMLSVSFYYIQPVIKNLSEYNFPSTINDLLTRNNGLIVISGAFGSGRTTTAISMLEEINKLQGKNVVMLEESLEVVMISKRCLISQRQIGVDVLSLTDGLEYCLQEDVDVVYVGRVRSNDIDNWLKIIELSSGNALVIVEMDEGSAIKVVQSIIDALQNIQTIEAARYNLADALLGVIVQELVPRIGGGQVLANEIMIANQPIKSLIRDGKIYQIDGLIQTSRQDGMIGMNRCLDELSKAGIIKTINK